MTFCLKLSVQLAKHKMVAEVARLKQHDPARQGHGSRRSERFWSLYKQQTSPHAHIPLQTLISVI
jgi:hypothetical protein